MVKEKSKILHYFDKIGVAVVLLTEDLNVGDTVKVSGKDYEFTQKVESMQLDHKVLDGAKKKSEVAVKFDQPVKKGDAVEKVS